MIHAQRCWDVGKGWCLSPWYIKAQLRRVFFISSYSSCQTKSVQKLSACLYLVALVAIVLITSGNRWFHGWLNKIMNFPRKQVLLSENWDASKNVSQLILFPQIAIRTWTCFLLPASPLLVLPLSINIHSIKMHLEDVMKDSSKDLSVPMSIFVAPPQAGLTSLLK